VTAPAPAPQIILARVPRSKREHENNGGLALLIWPMECDSYSGQEVTYWACIGQHGSAPLRALLDGTRPATAEEAQAAVAQWRREGPDREPEACPLLLRRRSPPWRVMVAEWNRQESAYRASVAADPAGAPWTPPRD